MEALLRVLACPRSAGGAAAAAAGAGAAAGVHEEAMQAVGAVALGVGRQFGKYMPSFYPYLKAGLINHQEWQVCLTTVGVLTDVCDAVGDELAPYGDEVVGMLIHNLGSNDVHRSIKPQARATPACPRTRLRLGPGPSIRPAACGSRGGAAGLLAASAEEAILSTFGDLALTLGAGFDKYVDAVRRMLQQAMQLSVAQ
ncbi:Importin subunit beta-1, partial [Monoraphidium neglectum]